LFIDIEIIGKLILNIDKHKFFCSAQTVSFSCGRIEQVLIQPATKYLLSIK